MKKNKIGYLIIASAVVWGAVIVGSSFKLRGTECYDAISQILFGGMIIHLIFIWGPLVAEFRRIEKPEKSSEN